MIKMETSFIDGVNLEIFSRGINYRELFSFTDGNYWTFSFPFGVYGSERNMN